MGVAGLWPFLRKNNYETVVCSQLPQVPQSLNPDNLTLPTIRVDVLASFYSSIRRFYSNQDLYTAHMALERQIATSGLPKSSVLYLDGPSPDEKQKTRESREMRRAHALQKSLRSISELEKRVEDKLRIRKR
ncbi:hypothetical protein EDD21DRAFT_408068 [Dissophora ornata]|nr:hypothetical protein EDD21DRAFT_408068 [Dissophora ornata]